MRHLAFLALSFMLGATIAHAASVEGYWYGKGYQPEVRKTLQWLTINNPDGTFSVEFRNYENCTLKSVQTETGWWNASGGIITKRIATVNGRKVPYMPYYSDTYAVLELDDSKLRLVHEKSKQEWTLQRVDSNFVFPDCKHVS